MRGFVLKSDSMFYEGLAAALASIRHWHPTPHIRIIDCGMSLDQVSRLAAAGFEDILAPDLSQFSVAPEMRHYYSRAVYAVLACANDLFDLSIHIDADAVLLQPVPELLDWNGENPGLAAVSDFPPLDLAFQIGDNAEVLEAVHALIPGLNTSSVSFNGGVFVLRRAYYLDELEATVRALMSMHNRLWGNEMAMLNLAAFAAKPEQPFFHMNHVFNHRPHYRRAPHLVPVRLAGDGPDHEPVMIGHFGQVRVLHFVGQEKPWHDDAERTPSWHAWQHYRALARAVHGL